MSKLADFLLARIQEEQDAAEATLSLSIAPGPARDPGWFPGRTGVSWGAHQIAQVAYPVLAEHIAHHDPAKVLADCQAKRQIVRMYQDQIDGTHDRDDEGWYVDNALAAALEALTLRWTDHPDYDSTWRK